MARARSEHPEVRSQLPLNDQVAGQRARVRGLVGAGDLHRAVYFFLISPFQIGRWMSFSTFFIDISRSIRVVFPYIPGLYFIQGFRAGGLRLWSRSRT